MEPCEFIIIDGTNIPGVTGINTTRVIIADKARTISGALNQTVLARKREWTVPLRVTGSERTLVTNLVDDTTNVRTVEIDAVGTVAAYVTIGRDQRVRRRAKAYPHAWDYIGGDLELRIEEV